jgi:acetyltransferase
MLYLKDDPKTRVILVYLEEITNGRLFMDTARRIIRESGKPVLVLKSGRTQEGAAAAASHTGSLAGSDDICDAALKQAGIIRCATIEEMFNTAIALAYQPLPRGNRVAIVTNAGGPGVLATDAAVKEKLVMARFSDATRDVFRKALPATANIKNPVDVIGDARADRYKVALSAALQDENVDGTLVILTPQSMTDIESIAEEVSKVGGQYGKPVYASFMGEMDVAPGVRLLQQRQVPHYILPESMCRAFAGAHFFRMQKEQPDEEIQELPNVNSAEGARVIASAVRSGKTYLPEAVAVPLLKAYGLPVLPSGTASSRDEAVDLAEKIGFPVVMKVVSEEIVHKFDVRGVVLDIRGRDQAAAAWDAIHENVRRLRPDARIDGVYLQKMVAGGQEVILGVKRDPSFGPVIMFGLGGIFVEVFRDVSFRVAPVGPRAAREMIHEIKACPMLTGARGKNPRDLDSVVECIQRLSRLAVEIPEIQELDINPLIVQDQGAGSFVADARILLTSTHEGDLHP